jgi:hypothetical protein
MNSIEWLINAMENPHKNINWEDTKQQAKEIHKQEIIDAANQNQFDDIAAMGYITKGEQYYDGTFGSEGSGAVELPQQEISINELKNICQSVIDNTPSDATEKEIGYTKAMEHIIKIIDGQPHKYLHPEISDEEIEKAAKECRFEDLDISVGSFELGAKWAIEKLKNR